MRRLFILLLMIAAALPAAVLAQSGAIRIVCEACRDPIAFPDDWANFAFNQVYGDEAWLDFDQADDFWIRNLDGDQVYVDVDFVMRGFNILGNEWPLWPTNMVQITLGLPNGHMLEVLRSVFVTGLPVPSSPGPGQDDNGSGGGGADSGNDGVDEPEPGDNEEPQDLPEIEYDGTTGIVDPDPYGDFPEPEWCQEC
ncbi:MAG: hypothetical protein QNJ23_01790 [Woeseiaceae bacterium]|nr:hypothetical protein [Woeseiaceae bacterium]